MAYAFFGFPQIAQFSDFKTLCKSKNALLQISAPWIISTKNALAYASYVLPTSFCIAYGFLVTKVNIISYLNIKICYVW